MKTSPRKKMATNDDETRYYENSHSAAEHLPGLLPTPSSGKSVSVNFTSLSDPSVAEDAPPLRSLAEMTAEGTDGAPTEQGAAPPVWFRKKRELRAEQEAVSSVVVSEAEPEDWSTHWKRWLRNARAALGISSVGHVIALLILGLIILPQSKDDELRLTSGLTEDAVLPEDDSEAVELSELLPEIEEAGDFSSEPEVAAPEIPEVDSAEMMVGIDPDLMKKSGVFHPDGDGVGTGGKGVGLEGMPTKNAVKKGSFTAWTKPVDPEPGQPYVIFLRIEVKPGMKRYPVGDLKGSFVVGSDDYFQPIPYPHALEEIRPVIDGQVLLSVPVPPADKNVKDIITVTSKILKEKQVLELVF